MGVDGLMPELGSARCDFLEPVCARIETRKVVAMGQKFKVATALALPLLRRSRIGGIV